MGQDWRAVGMNDIWCAIPHQKSSIHRSAPRLERGVRRVESFGPQVTRDVTSDPKLAGDARSDCPRGAVLGQGVVLASAVCHLDRRSRSGPLAMCLNLPAESNVSSTTLA